MDIVIFILEKYDNVAFEGVDMGLIELEKEYTALFERWREGRDSEIFASFIERETANPGSFLPWFQANLLLKQAYRHTDYIYLFNAVIPHCFNLDTTVLLDCSESMMKMTQGDLIASKAYEGLVEYCQRSMETLESVLQVLSSDIERWKSSVSIIIQTCYTHDSELIPLFICDALEMDSIPVQYSLAMSCIRLEVSTSSETNKGHFYHFLEIYVSRFPTLPLGAEKAAVFCVIMHLSSQLNDPSSKVSLQSFFDELFLMTAVAMEFSFSVFTYYHHILQATGELAAHDWEVVSYLLQNSLYSNDTSYFPMDHLLELLYLHDPEKAISVFLLLIRQNPNVSIKEFYGLLDEMKNRKDMVRFIITLLLDGGWSVISPNTESIVEALDTSMGEISNALCDVVESDLAFLARKSISALWSHPSVLCPFLLALLVQSSDKQVRSTIQEYLIRWIVIPYPKAFRAYKEKALKDASSSGAEIELLTLLYKYSVDFESSMEEIPRLKEIQPSLEHRYHKGVYDTEHQEAVIKQGREHSIFRRLATNIPILFANSALNLYETNLETDSPPEVTDMHTLEYSMDLSRRLLWEYPTVEMELALYASEVRA